MKTVLVAVGLLALSACGGGFPPPPPKAGDTCTAAQEGWTECSNATVWVACSSGKWTAGAWTCPSASPCTDFSPGGTPTIYCVGGNLHGP